MRCGRTSSRQRPHDAACSSRAPSAQRAPERYGLNSKTVAKWRRRSFTADAPMGPSDPRSTVLRPDLARYACDRHLRSPTCATRGSFRRGG